MERHLGRARHDLGAERTERAWQEGKRIAFDEAIAIALEIRDDDSERSGEEPAVSGK